MKIGKTEIITNDVTEKTTVFLPYVTTKGPSFVDAVPQINSAYRRRAKALGYGSDTYAMSRDHEMLHVRLADWLGLDASPTLTGVSIGQHWEHWQIEEDAVLKVQRYCRVLGIDPWKL